MSLASLISAVDSSVEYSTQEDGSIVGVPIVTVSTVGLYYNGANYTPDKNVAEMSVDEFVTSLNGQNMAWQTVDNAWTSMLFLTALVANEEGGAEWLQEYDGTKCYDYNTDWIALLLSPSWSTSGTRLAVRPMSGKAYADAANDFMSGNSAVICNGTWMNSEFTRRWFCKLVQRL